MNNNQSTITYPSKTKRILKALSWLIAGNPAQKKRVRLECARIAASLFGDFPLGDDDKLWLDDKKFRDQFTKLSPLSPYSMERKWTIQEFARYTRTLSGNMAECGCYDGTSAFFMAQENPDVPLHLFDSFEGLSEPHPVDKTKQKDERAWQKGDLSISEQVARNRLKEFKNVHFHKGWIPDKFSEVTNETFRLVHIDVDLYQPTKDSLEFFFPRMSRHGVIIFDDYGSKLCPGAHRAIEEFSITHDLYIIHLATMQGVLIIN